VPAPDFQAEHLYGAEYFQSRGAAVGYDDYSMLEAALRATFAARIRRIEAPRAGATMLDVGAAYGFAVAEATRQGWRAVGLDVSHAAALEARERTGADMVVADAHWLPFAADAFDAVTLWDVVEHLPDPHQAVAEVCRVLRPGGRLVLSTGDVGSLVARLSGARWHLYTIPEHLFFFSRRSLRILLERHGLRVESIRARAGRYPIGYLWERIRKTILKRAAPRPPGSWSALAKVCLPVNLWDVVTATAVRP
jgi:SAM-dependent methyltransferase